MIPPINNVFSAGYATCVAHRWVRWATRLYLVATVALVGAAGLAVSWLIFGEPLYLGAGAVVVLAALTCERRADMLQARAHAVMADVRFALYAELRASLSPEVAEAPDAAEPARGEP